MSCIRGSSQEPSLVTMNATSRTSTTTSKNPASACMHHERLLPPALLDDINTPSGFSSEGVLRYDPRSGFLSLLSSASEMRSKDASSVKPLTVFLSKQLSMFPVKPVSKKRSSDEVSNSPLSKRPRFDRLPSPHANSNNEQRGAFPLTQDSRESVPIASEPVDTVVVDERPGVDSLCTTDFKTPQQTQTTSPTRVDELDQDSPLSGCPGSALPSLHDRVGGTGTNVKRALEKHPHLKTTFQPPAHEGNHRFLEVVEENIDAYQLEGADKKRIAREALMIFEKEKMNGHCRKIWQIDDNGEFHLASDKKKIAMFQTAMRKQLKKRNGGVGSQANVEHADNSQRQVEQHVCTELPHGAFVKLFALQLVMQHYPECLPPEWEEAVSVEECPRLCDVIAGRGARANNQPGNKLMRQLVSKHEHRYADICRSDKTKLSSSVAHAIRAVGGRFLKKRGEHWDELSFEIARIKVSQAFRDHGNTPVGC